MKQELTLKVYEIDYSFILKNYLDPQLWEKEWNLFVYKDITFVLYLESINTRNSSIIFGIRSEHTIDGSKDHDTRTFSYNLKNSNLDSLKRQIKGEMERLIETMERYSIQATSDYKKARDLENRHHDNLKSKAEDFLDKNGIYLSEVRDAYIDYYTSKMSYDYTSNIMQALSHDLMFEVYMIFYKATKQMDKFDKLKENYKQRHYRDYENVMEEIDEKLEYLETSDYDDEMEDGLDDIM